jgi:hypothetical protein
VLAQASGLEQIKAATHPVLVKLTVTGVLRVRLSPAVVDGYSASS